MKSSAPALPEQLFSVWQYTQRLHDRLVEHMQEQQDAAKFWEQLLNERTLHRQEQAQFVDVWDDQGDVVDAHASLPRLRRLVLQREKMGSMVEEQMQKMSADMPHAFPELHLGGAEKTCAAMAQKLEDFTGWHSRLVEDLKIAADRWAGVPTTRAFDEVRLFLKNLLSREEEHHFWMAVQLEHAQILQLDGRLHQLRSGMARWWKESRRRESRVLQALDKAHGALQDALQKERVAQGARLFSREARVQRVDAEHRRGRHFNARSEELDELLFREQRRRQQLKKLVSDFVEKDKRKKDMQANEETNGGNQQLQRQPNGRFLPPCEMADCMGDEDMPLSGSTIIYDCWQSIALGDSQGQGSRESDRGRLGARSPDRRQAYFLTHRSG